MVYKNMKEEKKTLIYLLRVLVGESYMSNDSQHQKNERAYAS